MSESRLLVKPAEGLIVQKSFADVGRKENINVLGEHVPNTLYYRRLIKRGELVKIDKIETVEEPKTKIKSKTEKV